MTVAHQSSSRLRKHSSTWLLDAAGRERESGLTTSLKPDSSPLRTANKIAPRGPRPSRRQRENFSCDVTKNLVARRSGVSLIEVLVVITILTLMITLTGTTFHLLLRTEKLVSQSFVTERSISQLAVQFRNDVHLFESGAVVSDTEAGASELVLGDANGAKIRYAASRAGLIRVQIDGERVVAREDYRLPECRVTLLSGPEADGSLLILVIERPGAMIVQKEHQPRPLRALRIEARLNRLSGNRSAGSETGARAKSDSTESQQ